MEPKELGYYWVTKNDSKPFIVEVNSLDDYGENQHGMVNEIGIEGDYQLSDYTFLKGPLVKPDVCCICGKPPSITLYAIYKDKNQTDAEHYCKEHAPS